LLIAQRIPEANGLVRRAAASQEEPVLVGTPSQCLHCGGVRTILANVAFLVHISKKDFVVVAAAGQNISSGIELQTADLLLVPDVFLYILCGISEIA